MPGPLPAVPKGVRCDFHFSQAADPNMQIREFFQYTGTLNTTDAQTWLGNMVTALATFVNLQLVTDISLVLSELTDLTSNTAAQVQDNTVHAGSGPGQVQSAGVSFVIRKHILRRYRGGHPRVYIPGIAATRLATPTQWNAADVSAITSAYTTFIGACTANTNPAAIGTITHVNISYFQGFTNHTFPSGRVKAIPTPRVTPLVDLVVGLGGNAVPGSQRRRNEQP